jgi:beta-galactosidase
MTMSDSTRREFLAAGGLLVAGTVLFRPEAAHAALLSNAVAGAESAGDIKTVPTLDVSPREHLMFNFDWKFFQGHATDPSKDLNLGTDQGDFAKTGAFQFAQPKFEDSSWQSIHLPHDWAVELPFVNDRSLASHGFKPLGRKYPETSVGWYRRTFQIPKEDEGRRIYINFDGVFRSALVFLNGAFIGRSDSGYAPFGFEVSDFLNYGQANALVVRVDASYGDGWFYEGAGIYRHVWLTKVDPLHLGQWETYVRTEVQAGSAALSLGTVVENLGSAKEKCGVRWQIFDQNGEPVAQAMSQVSDIPADGKAEFSATAKLMHPSIWSPQNPALYYAVASVETNGKVRDRDKVSFGVRTLGWDTENGFSLNGQKFTIQGTCNHQDHAGVGSAVPDRLQANRMEVLKGMGCNAIRTSHNLPTPELVEACDRLGMLVFCETRMMSSNEEGMTQLSSMVRRFRNYPSIFVWSMGNEEWALQQNDAGPRVIRSMQERVKELDPTRLCTAAVNGSYDKPLAPSLEVMGFNYNLQDPDRYHAAHPAQFLIGSETASSVATRGVYITDKLRNWVSAYDVNQPGWGETDEEWWKFYASRKWLSGGFAWTGFDYRGEPTPYGWPSVSSQFGIVDTCGFAKDAYYYYKAWWGSEPVLHLFPHWNWDNREGEPIRVWVHSNLEEVELLVNGVTQGRKKVEPLTHLEWSVRYEAGMIEARGFKNGKVVLTDKRQTTGAPAKLVLTADRTNLLADGEDLVLVRIETVDKNGLLVPTADNFVRLSVTGEGALIGVGNGDPNCQESDKHPSRSLFNGLAQAIVQTTKKPGSLTVQATSHQLDSASLTIITKETALRASVDSAAAIEPTKARS